MLSSLVWSILFSMPKAAETQLLVRIRNSPGVVAIGGRADFTVARCGEPALSIDDLGDLSDHPQEKLNPRDFSDRREQKEVISTRDGSR